MSHSIKHYDIKSEGITHVHAFPKHAVFLHFGTNDYNACARYNLEVLAEDNDESINVSFVVIGRRHDLDGMISDAATANNLQHVGSLEGEDEYDHRYTQHLFLIKDE